MIEASKKGSEKMTFDTLNKAFLLNGKVDVLHSTVNLGEDEKKHEEECWIYLNGVSVGSHWLQSNLNRLALTFRRPITGVHNRTYGLVFDLLQCILERDFLYATTDIRRSYVTIKASLLKEKNKKVVLILHSQGGIEGSLILDWLLTELPHDTVSKLEIYTFGSAANHFNSPPRHDPSQRSAQAVVNGTSNALHITTNGDVASTTATSAPNSYAVRHIEHYASTGEFVACWGVLYFSRLKNRYAGRVFMRPGTGHLLNQHYLNAMFPLDKDLRVDEDNEFMETRVDILRDGGEDNVMEGSVGVLLGNGEGQAESVRRREMGKKAKVKYFSRLWEYRNGKSPED
ncbi:hypothetical protein SLS60_005662 [Paraconiothyrium brasiliense]|uniref:DUF676 domain-containing protein n=1 Tax=Paraconiothyrium brasiliense TaxID=300254 RepID=A0ABR3RI13_9PLEO